jgi:hypothetical protein
VWAWRGTEVGVEVRAEVAAGVPPPSRMRAFRSLVIPPTKPAQDRPMAQHTFSLLFPPPEFSRVGGSEP